jgi:hypothetical protein
MHEGRIGFAQLLDFLPRHEFNLCVGRYHGKIVNRQSSIVNRKSSITWHVYDH